MIKALLTLALACPLLAAENPAASAIQDATEAFLETLDQPRLEKATFDFDDKERENWHYTPRERAGLALKDMNEAQKNAGVGLITATLSEKASYKAAQIILLEGVLAALESNPEYRDVEKYYAAVFGTPGDPDGWGYHFEGHHLSINVTIVEGQGISVTPCFMGANPAEVREGDNKGMRPLAAEEDLARALAVALLESGNNKVVFDQKPPKEILTGEDRVAKQLDPVGITVGTMSESQQAAFYKLVAEFTGNFREEISSAEFEAIKAIDKDKLHFGWAGSIKPGEAYYYRIQAPTFLIETANTQNDANHIHTVWREFDGDFGRDLLKEHLSHEH